MHEVEAAGNTPLHSAAFQGWVEGIELLLQMGAKVRARARHVLLPAALARREHARCLLGPWHSVWAAAHANAAAAAGERREQRGRHAVAHRHVHGQRGGDAGPGEGGRARTCPDALPHPPAHRPNVQHHGVLPALCVLRSPLLPLCCPQAGASKAQGKVLVQEHVPKVKDFYDKECWSHHPLPYADFVAAKRKEREALESARKFVIRD